MNIRDNHRITFPCQFPSSAGLRPLANSMDSSLSICFYGGLLCCLPLLNRYIHTCSYSCCVIIKNNHQFVNSLKAEAFASVERFDQFTRFGEFLVNFVPTRTIYSILDYDKPPISSSLYLSLLPSPSLCQSLSTSELESYSSA